MAHMDPSFERLLPPERQADLEVHSGTVYGVWADFTLSYFNPAWFGFAGENGGEPAISRDWGMGTSILKAISDDLRGPYRARWEEVLQRNVVFSHEYECSGPSLFRQLHQSVYPLGDGEGLLMVNSLVVALPHDPKDRVERAARESEYRNRHGFIVQCSYCRRVERQHGSGQWDWVPDYVRKVPENTSHTYCPQCFAHYFSDRELKRS